MSQRTPMPAPGNIIPFPRYKQSAPRRAARPVQTSPDFDAGFEMALALVRAFHARGMKFPA